MISTKAEQYLLQSCILIHFFLYGELAISKKFIRDAFYHIISESFCFSEQLENNFFFFQFFFFFLLTDVVVVQV